jgi:hypothetical protein
MSAVDRVMRAYLRTRTLTADQHRWATFEIARLIDEFRRDATKAVDHPRRLDSPTQNSAD